MYFDSLWWVFGLPGMLLSLWASFRVKQTFERFSHVASRRGLSGAEVAQEIVRRRGIPGVTVAETSGYLSDHYDPRDRTLRLSSDVYRGRSLAAIGVAAHEAGHAIQHASDYLPLSVRSLVVKPAQLGSNFGVLLASAGLIFHSMGLVWVGVIFFSAFVLFTLVTLPVEIDASRRALVAIEELGILTKSEAEGARTVLRAAALTYVAGAITAVLQLLYFLIRSGLIGSRRRN
jgi:Zn-dependent membrane protease YugP